MSMAAHIKPSSTTMLVPRPVYCTLVENAIPHPNCLDPHRPAVRAITMSKAKAGRPNSMASAKFCIPLVRSGTPSPMRDDMSMTGSSIGGTGVEAEVTAAVAAVAVGIGVVIVVSNRFMVASSLSGLSMIDGKEKKGGEGGERRRGWGVWSYEMDVLDSRGRLGC
jgi:hypothetical protein